MLVVSSATSELCKKSSSLLMNPSCAYIKMCQLPLKFLRSFKSWLQKDCNRYWQVQARECCYFSLIPHLVWEFESLKLSNDVSPIQQIIPKEELLPSGLYSWECVSTPLRLSMQEGAPCKDAYCWLWYERSAIVKLLIARRLKSRYVAPKVL